MAGLVAIDIEGGPAFVTALQAVWDAGDAVLPAPRPPPPPLLAGLDHRGARTGRDHRVRR
ncbi:MAG: hypothetical protein V9G12_14945 [Microthrixaceae bacterium]